MLIQQAYRIVSNDKIVISTHVHDFVEFNVNGKKCYIDGGTSYCRGSINVAEAVDKGELEDLIVTKNMKIKEKADKLVWGTRGKNSKSKVEFVKLKDCSEEHLKNILEHGQAGEHHQKAIRYILGIDK